jgi:hypothetical protein
MFGCRWPDNRRRPDNDLLMPMYVYVKIIWRITSYSTLFILKRNTGNCFYLLSYVRLSESFLKKSVRKRCLVFLLLFNFIDVPNLRSFKMSLKFESLSCSKNSNNVSAQFNNSFERHGQSNSWLIEARRTRIAQSVQRLATAWTVRVSNPCWSEIFRSVHTGPGAHPLTQRVPGHSWNKATRAWP